MLHRRLASLVMCLAGIAMQVDARELSQETAQESKAVVPATNSAAAQAAAVNTTNRELLAWWYLQADTAWAKRREAGPVTREITAAANRTFDNATLSFFRLDVGNAISTLTELRESFGPAQASQSSDKARLPPAVLTIMPRVCRGDLSADATPQPSFAISFLRAPEKDLRGSYWLTLTSMPSTTIPAVKVDINLKAGEVPAVVNVPMAGLVETLHRTAAGEPALWEFSLLSEDRTVWASERLATAAFSLNSRRAENVAAIKALPEIDPGKPVEEAAAVKLARSIFLSRNTLLTDAPNRNNSAQFLANWGSLPGQLELELRQVTAGKSPYPLEGRWWTGVKTSSGTIGCWIESPARAERDKSSALPLLVLLHGAGGDESMFMFGYGGGTVVKQAVARGMVVCSVATTQMMASKEAFDEVVTFARGLFNIDPVRIYVAGHSMGAMAASSIAQRPGIAAAVCFAGGQFREDKPTCPVLVIAGAIDPIVAVAGLEAMVEKAKRDTITFVSKADYGHTLLVGDFAAEMLDYLHRFSCPAVPITLLKPEGSAP